MDPTTIAAVASIVSCLFGLGGGSSDNPNSDSMGLGSKPTMIGADRSSDYVPSSSDLAGQFSGSAYDPGVSSAGAPPSTTLPQQTVSSPNTNTSLISPAIGAVGALGGAAINYLGQSSANAANIAQAQNQQAFQAQQTSTQWQRAVADMEAAGLNPMLAYSQGPNAAATGSMARVENPASSAVSSALQGISTLANLNDVVAHANNLDANTDNIDENTRLLRAQRIFLTGPETSYKGAATDQASASAEASRAGAAFSQAQTRTTDLLRTPTFQQAVAAAKGAMYGLPALENASNAAQTWWGKYVVPYLPSFLQGGQLMNHFLP